MKETFELEILKKTPLEENQTYYFLLEMDLTMERDGLWLFCIFGIEQKTFMKAFFLFFNSLKGRKVQRSYKEISSEYLHFNP